MEQRGLLAGPRGRASSSSSVLLDMPDEILLQILREVEAQYLASGRLSAEFLQLRTVCKRLKQGVDSSIASLSRGIARKFCRREPLGEVKAELARQLARWDGLRSVELHVRGSNCALTQLVPALSQTCPGLTALRIRKSELKRGQVRPLQSFAHLTSLTALDSLSLTGFQSFTITLPPLPSLRTLDTDCGTLACPSPLPSLEALVFGRKHGLHSASRQQLWFLDMPHLHTSSRLHHLSLRHVRVRQLRLPKSLRILSLASVRLSLPMDLKEDVPELAQLAVVHKHSMDLPLRPQDLFTLLSRGRLLQLKLQGTSYSYHHVNRLTIPEALALQTGLTSLSLHSMEAPQMQELLPSLTALTELELGDLKKVNTLNVSHLNLHHLKLVGLPELFSIEGLGSQTRLKTLVLAKLPLITHLPDLSISRRLARLELTNLWLRNWSPHTCSALPSLTLLHMSEVLHPAPQATSLAASQPPRGRPPPAVNFSLDLGTLSTLTDLRLRGLADSAFDVSSLALLEVLRLHDCHELSSLSGLRSLPCLRHLELLHPMPKLHTLTIASCHHLTGFSCLVSRLERLTLEDLPRLGRLNHLPNSLRTLHVAACHSLKSMRLENPHYFLESIQLTGLPELRLPKSGFTKMLKLKSIRLDGLAKVSGLIVTDCPLLESIHVSGSSPPTKLVLQDLPRLSIPNVHINRFQLHTPHASPLPDPSTSLISSPTGDPNAPPFQLPSLASPQSRQSLHTLALRKLPGLLALDSLLLHTRLTDLRLEGLHVSRLPVHWGSLTALTALVLKDLELEHMDPLPPGSLSGLLHLTLAGRGSCHAARWTGIGTSLKWSLSPAGAEFPRGGVELESVWSITKLELSELPEVSSLDVRQLSAIQELTVDSCASLTRLAGITSLPSLTRVKLTLLPKLQELAIVSCPALTSLAGRSFEPLHLHMEDLPKLKLDAICFHELPWSNCTSTYAYSHCFPWHVMGSLKSLKLRGLPSLSRLLLRNLSALESVEVSQCSSLSHLEVRWLLSLTSLGLNELTGEVASEATSSSSSPTHVDNLFIVDMPNLKSIVCPPNVHNLVVRSCPALTSLPLDHLLYLEKLTLRGVSKEALPVWLKQGRHLRKLDFQRSDSDSDQSDE